MQFQTTHDGSPNRHSRPALRRVLLAVAALALLPFASGCAVTPGQDVAIPVMSQPLFDSISLEGLVTRESRAAGRSSTITSGQVTASLNNSLDTATFNTVDRHNTTHYEYYNSTALRDQLRRLIEDHRVARKVTRDSDVRVVGRVVSRGADTGAGRITWNVFNCLGPCFIGLPFLGSVAADVELRVYRGDELLSVHRGTGSATWYHPVIGIVPRSAVMRGRSIDAATWIATKAAVRHMLEHAPPRAHATGTALQGENSGSLAATR